MDENDKIAQLEAENASLKAKIANMEIAFWRYVMEHSTGCDLCSYEYDETCPGCYGKKDCWKWNEKTITESEVKHG